MEVRHLGDLEVSAIGLGCMGMSHGYGGQPEEEATATLYRAVELGVTLFDTAELYGPWTNEELLGRALAPFRGRVRIATKFGYRFERLGPGQIRNTGTDGRPETVRATAEASLKRLQVEVIDLLYQHRTDPAVPVEETVGAMGELVAEGKLRGIGLCEVGPETIRRAHATHPLTAIQSEYSLWTREPEAGVLPLCRELGIGFVPFAPLGRGLIAGSVTAQSQLAEGDRRRNIPRFTDAAIAANAPLLAALGGIAEAKGVTMAQLALAWLLHQGPAIVPIPGARRIAHLEQNCAAAGIALSAEDLAAIEAASPAERVTGARYAEADLARTGR